MAKLASMGLLFLCIPHISQAMLIKNPEIAQLIKLSLLNKGNDLFSVTRVVEYKDGVFIKKGDLLSLTNQNIAQIEKNNFIYQPFFGYEETRLSQDHPQRVGALLIGTTDEKQLNHPLFSRLRTLSPLLKKSKL